MKKIQVGSTGTGSTDGLASHLLAKFNVILFAEMMGYEFLHIPFDDYIKGNSGHRFGDFSTTLQNTAFNFPGFELVNPLKIDYKKIIRICASNVPKNGVLYDGQQNHFVPESVIGSENIRKYIAGFVEQNREKLILIDGFSNLFSDSSHVYSIIAKKWQSAIVNPKLIVDLSPSPLLQHIDQKILNVAIHIRRGDVTVDNHPNRFVSVDYFNGVVASFLKVIKLFGLEAQFTVHSEQEINGLSFDYMANYQKNPVKSFYDIYAADFVIASKGSHSSVPTMLSGAPSIIPEDTWMPCLPSWIPANKETGKFDEQALLNILKSLH